ncbi:YjfB family protein [Bacillus tuaregi]|uniref:YjfB family protein n=1 Tax=Bacillus tuaregi TaxID=1816695 RepID=UPI0008F8CABA|nr:YjfB family protein [Bacillus tuaregi]
MDIAAMSMALSQGQLSQQVSLSLMKQVMDQAEGNADFINKMMSPHAVKALELKAQPHLGGNIDIKG